MSDLVSAIKAYYKRNHITPATYRNFGCPDKRLCGKGCKGLATGNEPFIGSRYQSHRPRLLIISAEAGEGNADDPRGRTVEGHAKWEKDEKTAMAESLHPKTHWFKTAQTAIWIFEVIKTGKPSKWVWDASRRPEFPTVAPYWAHTNSGKCSQNRDGHGSADGRLFDNCRKYLGREIRILDPDIIVSQGGHALDAVEAAIEWKEIESTKLSSEPRACNTLVVAGHPVLWIAMHHPNSRGIWYEQIKSRAVYWSARIRAFVGKEGLA